MKQIALHKDQRQHVHTSRKCMKRWSGWAGSSQSQEVGHTLGVQNIGGESVERGTWWMVECQKYSNKVWPVSDFSTSILHRIRVQTTQYPLVTDTESDKPSCSVRESDLT